MVKVILASLVVVAYIFLILHYYRLKKIISLAETSLFPSFAAEWKNIFTRMGKVEKPTFELKMWKQKRIVLVISIILMAIAMNTAFFFWKSISWTYFLIIFNVLLIIMFTWRVPSFYMLPNGFYYDERFYTWDQVNEFSIAPVTMKSDGYGMFENSHAYTEINLQLKKGLLPNKNVYVNDVNDVKRMKKILINNGVREGNNLMEK